MCLAETASLPGFTGPLLNLTNRQREHVHLIELAQVADAIPRLVHDSLRLQTKKID
jgi:hypothetical protein